MTSVNNLLEVALKLNIDNSEKQRSILTLVFMSGLEKSTND